MAIFDKGFKEGSEYKSTNFGDENRRTGIDGLMKMKKKRSHKEIGILKIWTVSHLNIMIAMNQEDFKSDSDDEEEAKGKEFREHNSGFR